ncbi:52 kDa repressor of the inhibitor of the protein kinase-like [Aphis craccivora]|uniref:52 kDa repressor of the inhibitor of the protein kinase-like n=1 Tax=Aphis craccivora TaxID=307492 RepID=A0A6G0Y8Y7_APHCR|nr:52 kDa repressor of the inhibitor of the protein kinase-like [Aphis craccivora]
MIHMAPNGPNVQQSGIIDECTDTNLNDHILNGELDLWYRTKMLLKYTSKPVHIHNTSSVYGCRERSFSTPRRSKTYLRNSSGQI